MNTTIQGALASRTMKFAALLAVLSTVEANLGLLTPYMTQENMGLMGVCLAIAIAGLRAVTSQPLATRAVVTTTDTTIAQ